MLDKEKCEKALEVLECKAYDGCDKCYSQDEELCKKCEDKDFVEVDIIKQLIKEHFDNQCIKWIPIEEMLPELGEKVIACDGIDIMIGFIFPDKQYGGYVCKNEFYSLHGITAWAPYKPYKKDGEEE